MLPLERLLLISVGTIVALSASWYWFFARRNARALPGAKRAVDEEEAKPKAVSAPSRKQRQLPVVVSATPTPKPVKAKKEEVPYEKLGEEDKEKVLNQIKEEGNNFYKAGDWMRAISCYSDAIEKSESNNAIFLNNRSAAYIQIRDFTAGLKDAERVVELEPENLKGLFRVASCYANLRKHDLALNASLRVLNLQPDHKEAQEIVKQSNQILQEEQIRLSEQNRKLQQEAEEDEAEEINAETVTTEAAAPVVQETEPDLPERTESPSAPEQPQEEESGVVIEHNVSVSEAIEAEEEEILADSVEAHPVLEQVVVAPLVEETKLESAEEEEEEIVADHIESHPEEPTSLEETAVMDREIEVTIPAESPAEEEKQESSEEEIVADDVHMKEEIVADDVHVPEEIVADDVPEHVHEEIVADDVPEHVHEDIAPEEEFAVAEETAGLTINNEEAHVEAAVPAEEDGEEFAQFEEVQQADVSISENHSDDIAVPEDTASLEIDNEDREVEATIPAENPAEEEKQESSEEEIVADDVHVNEEIVADDVHVPEEIVADDVPEEPAHEEFDSEELAVAEETAGLEIQNEEGIVEPAIYDDASE